MWLQNFVKASREPLLIFIWVKWRLKESTCSGIKCFRCQLLQINRITLYKTIVEFYSDANSIHCHKYIFSSALKAFTINIYLFCSTHRSFSSEYCFCLLSFFKNRFTKDLKLCCYLNAFKIEREIRLKTSLILTKDIISSIKLTVFNTVLIYTYILILGIKYLYFYHLWFKVTPDEII